MRPVLGIAGAFALALAFVAIVAVVRPSINLTASMPIGLYRRLPVERAPRVGDIVEVCLPLALARFARARDYVPPGECRANAAPLLKRVVAVSGDVVDLRVEGETVNGRALPGSATIARDQAGRSLPAIARRRYRVRPGEIWLWTPAPRSWDSRYYGALAVADVRAFDRALFVRP